MAIQKKHGKGRLDKYYRLAKEKGYRARAAFKLIQLNKKYHVLEKSKVLLDLCAAPGSWCQVAAEVMPPGSLIVGVDLSPMKPIPRCITFQSDITTDKCRATIRQHFKTWKADTVLHDGAPNVGTAWVQDAFTQAELVLQSLRLATDFLRPGGTFITKIFRSKDYNSLLWVFNQLFGKVDATKPPSSRNVSAEIFVVCLDYKAPKKIDPRFLDPKTVFADLTAPTPNNEAKVFNPEVKKRKREGYEEGDWIQFKEAPASEFIQTTDPIAMLGTLNKLSFEQTSNGDLALAALDPLPETTEEVRACAADLKVLGRKDFKLLLKWRLKVREKFGFSGKKESEKEAGEEIAEVEPMDEEMQIQEELQKLKERADSRKKKEKRRNNEQKQKEIVRMQMNMATPFDIGMDQAGAFGEGAMFDLKTTNKEDVGKIAQGRMHSISAKAEPEPTQDLPEEEEGDEEEDDLEGQLDAMYERYQERKAEVNAKYRAKKARTEHTDEFEGFSEREDISSDEEIARDDDSDNSSDEEVTDATSQLRIGNGSDNGQGLSKRASMFFDQDIFKDIGLDDPSHDDSGIELEEPSSSGSKDEGSDENAPSKMEETEEQDDEVSDSESEAGFEVVKKPQTDEWSEEQLEPTKNGRPDIDIITAEAMTLAQSIASGSKTRQSLIDEGFNKYSHRDVEGLPAWFLDDEGQHSRPHKPTTAAAAAAIKEKMRAMNARPIKKVWEAKARKKFKAAQKLEKLKKKSAVLLDDEDMTEKDKAKSIEKMMARAAKKKPKQQVKVVVAKGGNRGLQGRPKGTKGKYKMVDRRLKKDTRAEKRLAKKRK